MNISQRFEGLISVEFDQNHWNRLLVFVVVLQNSKDCFGNVIHHDIQIDFIWFVSLGVKCMFQSDNIWVKQFFHNLQFSILVPLILINLFDGNLFSILVHSRLKHNSKWAISNNSISVICETCLLHLFVILAGLILALGSPDSLLLRLNFGFIHFSNLYLKLINCISNLISFILWS